MSTTVIEARDLCAGYGKAPMLRNVNLRVDAGEVVALFGPNGAGKTTTILTLAGELAASRGDVLIAGEVTRKPLHRRARQGLALVPEQRAIVPELSVRDNLRIGRGSIEDALELFPQLERLRDRKAGLLSGGEQQMLALGRALAGRPRVLLVDELSLGLAPVVVRQLLAAVERVASSGVGVLLVEQFAHRALEIADRAYVLNRGRIVFEATREQTPGLADRLESLYLSADADDAAGERDRPSAAGPTTPHEETTR